jgi:uncharacterized protein
MPSTERAARVIAETSAWLDRVVIGLGLCPFAKAVQTRQLVRYRVTDAQNESELLVALEEELTALATADPQLVDTTLLIHPSALGVFLDYNDFLSEADDKLAELELDGELQIASFHPDYCFGGAPADDPANYSNRSPYPMLHLLRESSVSLAVAAFPEASRIYERNVALLRGLAPEALARLIKG